MSTVCNIKLIKLLKLIYSHLSLMEVVFVKAGYIRTYLNEAQEQL